LGKINPICGGLAGFQGVWVKGQNFGLAVPFKGADGDINGFLVDKRTEGNLIVRNSPFSGKGQLGD
jgi:hypothetical protein